MLVKARRRRWFRDYAGLTHLHIMKALRVYHHISFKGPELSGVNITSVALGGPVVSVLATGPKVRGFNPGRGRWIFKGDKNP